MLRVVGCLPSGEDERGTTKPRGQASYKPRWRKPRNGPVRFAQQLRLWGLHAQSRLERDDPAGTSHIGIVQKPGSGVDVPNFLVKDAAGIGLIVA